MASMPEKSSSAKTPTDWSWAWGVAGLGLGGSIMELQNGSMVWLGPGLAVAFLGGVMWQRALRRDLAARLELLAWLLVVAALIWTVVALIPGTDDADFDLKGLHAFPGLVAGLVLTEIRLRKRDAA